MGREQESHQVSAPAPDARMLAQIWAGTTSLQVALSHSCLTGFSQPVRAPTSSCKACKPFGSSSDPYNAEGTFCTLGVPRPNWCQSQQSSGEGGWIC